MMDNTLLSVENAKKYYPVRSGFLSLSKAQLKAVDDVSFEVRRGETLGLVGESGCGIGPANQERPLHLTWEFQRKRSSGTRSVYYL